MPGIIKIHISIERYIAFGASGILNIHTLIERYIAFGFAGILNIHILIERYIAYAHTNADFEVQQQCDEQWNKRATTANI